VRRLRGVRPGLPDSLTLYRGKFIAIERIAASAREPLLRAGAEWLKARSANAAMWAVAESGVKFRNSVNADGAEERWKKPRLADWEKPRRDPSEPRPQHPAVIAQRRRVQRRWRARQRAARETASLAEREGCRTAGPA
jgi:hypothetical protein